MKTEVEIKRRLFDGHVRQKAKQACLVQLI